MGVLILYSVQVYRPFSRGVAIAYVMVMRYSRCEIARGWQKTARSAELSTAVEQDE